MQCRNMYTSDCRDITRWHSKLNPEHFNILNTCVFCLWLADDKKASKLIQQLMSKHIHSNPQQRNEELNVAKSFVLFLIIYML